MISAVDTIRKIIEGMTLKIRVRGAEVIDGGYKIYVDYTYYLSEGMTVVIDANTYKVLNVSIDNYIEVSGDASLANGTYTIRNPHFKHGKYEQYEKEFLNEMKAEGEQYLKAPFVYNVETQARTVPPDPDSIIDSEGDMRFLVFKTDNVNDKSIENTEEKVLKPLNRWIDSFIDALDRSYKIHDIGTVVRTNHRMITTKTNSLSGGQDSNIFKGRYSGVDLVINVQIKKNLDCIERDIPVAEGDAYSDAYSDAYG